MPKPARLKKRADFLRVAKGPRWAMPGLVLQAAPQPGGEAEKNAPRLGFTVTKKVGIAVKRNRARRRLKAAAEIVMPRLARPGMDYVLVGRDATLTRDFEDLVKDLETALGRLGDKTS